MNGVCYRSEAQMEGTARMLKNTHTHAHTCACKQAMSDQEGPQGVVEALSSSGAVSTWFMAHVYELLGAVPLGPAAGGSGGGGGGGRRSKAVPVLARPLPLSGGDQSNLWGLLCGCAVCCNACVPLMRTRAFLFWIPRVQSRLCAGRGGDHGHAAAVGETT
eukprot:1159058-Pelagomonas_calceolata.AAC.10